MPKEMQQSAEVVSPAGDQVFEHKGGVIRDENGERFFWDHDLPGWYFWNDDFDGLRRLYGPYESKEDAEFYQENQ